MRQPWRNLAVHVHPLVEPVQRHRELLAQPFKRAYRPPFRVRKLRALKHLLRVVPPFQRLKWQKVKRRYP